MRLLRGRLRRDGGCELLPRRLRVEVLFAEDLVLGRLHAHDERRVAARVEREVERLAALHVHLAHRPRVAHARERRERLDAQIGRRVRPQRLRVLEREAPHSRAAAVRRPAGDAQIGRTLQSLFEPVVARRGTELEAPIPHELGIEAPVHGERDVLQEDAPQRRRHLMPRLRYRHIHVDRRCGETARHCCRQRDGGFKRSCFHAESIPKLADDEGGTQLVDTQEEVVAGTFQKRPVSLRNRDARRVEREPLDVGCGGEPA